MEPASAPKEILPVCNGTKTTHKIPTLKAEDLNIFSLVTNSDYGMVSALKVLWSSKKAKELIVIV